MSRRSTDYDLQLIRHDYLNGDLTLTELEHQITQVLAGQRIHEHEWIDITTYNQPTRELTCAKCGERKAN